MDRFARCCGGSGGRSGHQRSIDAYTMIERTRESLATLFHAHTPNCVCLMSNATEALNTAIYGLARPGCDIVTTSMEHNAVWRPLIDLQKRLGCRLTVVRADSRGVCDPDELVQAITPGTALVVMTCASNVTGAIQPFTVVAERCARLGKPLVLDAAQAAGALELDMRLLPNVALVFTGHKGLLGPQGTGGFVVDPGIAGRIRPLKRGGTGTASGSSFHPEELPEKFESGTLNGHGLAGLGAGVEFLLAEGVGAIRYREMRLWQKLRAGLLDLPHVKVYGSAYTQDSVALVSCTVDGASPADVGVLLSAKYDIAVRTGLHCAPCAHETIGTLPNGTIRLSLGSFTTEDDIDMALAALAMLY